MAGLVLLMEHPGADGQHARWTRGQSPEILFDYFAGEVFDKTDQATQDVLLQAASLPSVTALLAQALTGAVNAGEVLADLHRQNYFTNKQALGEALPPPDTAGL